MGLWLVRCGVTLTGTAPVPAVLGYNGAMVTLSQVPALRLNLTLVEMEPPVWRELVVPGGWHLGKLHEVIQVAMGWENAHLHEFAVGELRWGQPDPLGFGDGRRCAGK